MKPLVQLTILCGVLALCLPACGGRASLAEDSGSVFKRTMSLQATSRRREALAPLSATDAKIIVRNHELTNSAGGKRGGSGGGKTRGKSRLNIAGAAR